MMVFLPLSVYNFPYNADTALTFKQMLIETASKKIFCRNRLMCIYYQYSNYIIKNYYIICCTLVDKYNLKDDFIQHINFIDIFWTYKIVF